MSDAKPTSRSAANGARKRWLAIVAGAFALIGIAYGTYWALVLRYEQSTDDADTQRMAQLRARSGSEHQG